ncbi:MAG: hypothetical protein WAX04_05560 [Oscillospiraceae bacterium]
MSRCIYCNKETEVRLPVKTGNKKIDVSKQYSCCSKECFKKADSFFKLSHRAMPIFIVILILYAIMVFTAFLGYIPIGYAVVLGFILGLTFLICPFSSTTSVESWSIKTTKITTRIVGGFVIVLNIMMMS